MKTYNSSLSVYAFLILLLPALPAFAQAPEVTNTMPVANALNVSSNASVTAWFDQDMNAATITSNTFFLYSGQSGLYRPAPSYDTNALLATLDPAGAFRPGEVIFANATKSIEGTNGAALDPHIWQFTVAADGGSGFFITNAPGMGTNTSYVVALGDLDGDGDLDAFVVNTSWQPNTVWTNDGSGLFFDSGQGLGAAQSYGVALGDVDNDGDLDALVANNFANTVWTNDGSGLFFNSGQSLGSSGGGVALGDLDGDGDLDAFVANSGGASTVWTNDGSGLFFNSGQSLGGANSAGVALGDLDGDGDLDAFVANDGGGFGEANTVWTNDGSGLFFNNGQSLGTAESCGIALGDLDGDGDLDAFVANYFEANTVWTNDGSGLFFDSGQSLVSAGRGVALGDVDGDGDLDAFVANYGEASTVWTNAGSGLFFDSGQSLGSANSMGVALGDLDSDGDLDAFVANIAQPNTVWLNQSPPAAPAGVWASDGTYTNKVQVGWSASSNATGYTVWRNVTNETGTATNVGASASTNYNDWSVSIGQTYFYWVKSTNSLSVSGFSSPDTGYAQAAVTAPTVNNDGGASNITASSATLNGTLTSTGGAPTQVTIYWGPSNGATNKAAWTNSIPMGTLGVGLFSTNITGLSSNTMYYYRCYATNSAGQDWADSTTNFTSGDSDGDGLPDSWEIDNFGSITNYAGSDDPDGDYWANTNEYSAGSQPTNANHFPMPDKRRGFDAAVYNGKIYLAGGAIGAGAFNTLWEFDPSNNQYAVKTPIPANRRWHRLVTLGTNLYLIGGSPDPVASTAVYRYDPVGDDWTNVASMNTARADFCAAALSGNIYVFGGHNNGIHTDAAEVYNAMSNTWTSITNLPYKSGDHNGLTGGDGRIYVIGAGDWGGSQPQDDVLIYDPVATAYQFGASLDSSRNHVGVVGIGNDTLLALGGGSPTTNRIDAYSLRSDNWDFNLSYRLLVDRNHHAAAIVGSNVYVFGGERSGVGAVGHAEKIPLEIYTVTASAGTNGTITPSGALSAVKGSSKSFTIAADTNCYIVDVVVDGGSIGATNSYTFSNISSNHTIHATFAIDTYTLTVSTPYGTAVPAGVTTNDWNALIDASITDSPVVNGATQYVCTGWTGTGSAPLSGATTNTSFNITNTSTLVWNWVTEYFLDITAGTNGSVNVGDAWYTNGAIVMITATADTGYYFVNWTGDVPSGDQTNNPLTLIMDQQRSITANFLQSAGTITIDVTPSNGTWTVTSCPADYTGPTSGTGDLSSQAAPVGSYTIEFGSLTGYTTPASVTGTVTTNATNTFSATYAALDTDNDGLTDPDEVNVYGTDPYNPDTDGDGYPDGYEVSEASDPLDPESYPVGSVTVTEPAAGAVAKEGKYLNVSWTANFALGTADIYLVRGTSFWTLATGVSCPDSSMSSFVMLPIGLSPGTNYHILVEGMGDIYGFGNSALFTVICECHGDYDGDGKADLCLYYPPWGMWFVLRSTKGYWYQQFGWDGPIPVPADYDGDGLADLAVYYPPTGMWYILTWAWDFWFVQFGYDNTIPVPGDYDGDGKADLAIYEETPGKWYIASLNGDVIVYGQNWGGPQFTPVPGDYDNDGKTDIAVYQEQSGLWHVISVGGSAIYLNEKWGGTGLVPVPGDYDGDGKTDLAVYEAESGTWYFRMSTAGDLTVQFGWDEPMPLSGDYDGDGLTDISLFYGPLGQWYLLMSTDGYWTGQFGWDGPIPLD